MKLPRAFREGALLTWRHLLALVWMNLLWVVLSWTIVLCGPATLAVYALIATSMREDRDPDLRRLPFLLRANLLPGVLWLLSTVLFAFLIYSNLRYWQAALGPFGDTVTVLLAGYLTWLYVALQPYLLEALSVDRVPFLRAWREAFLGLARAPLTAHLYVLIPLAMLLITLFTQTLVTVVLVSVALTFAATQVRPLVELPEPPEDDLPDQPAPA